MDVQIAPWLRVVKQTKEQCQGFQREMQVNQSAQAQKRQNRQQASLGQVRSTRY